MAGSDRDAPISRPIAGFWIQRILEFKANTAFQEGSLYTFRENGAEIPGLSPRIHRLIDALQAVCNRIRKRVSSSMKGEFPGSPEWKAENNVCIPGQLDSLPS